MSFGGRNGRSTNRTGGRKAAIIKQYESGKIDYRTFKELTTPRLSAVPFTGRLKDTEKYFDSDRLGKSTMATMGSLSMSNTYGSLTSTMDSTFKKSGSRSLKKSASALGTGRGTANMVLQQPPSREQRNFHDSLGDSIDTLIPTSKPATVAVAVSKDSNPAQSSSSDQKGKSQLGPYDLALWKDRLPPHQYKVMKEDIMYTPDPMTGIAHWPIPGMQGSRSPFRHIPFGSGPDQKMTTTKDASDKHGVGKTGKFEWKEYKSDGIGGKVTWKGKGIEELTRVQRSYEQSGMMSTLVPGQADCLRQKRVRKPGALPLC